MAVVLRVWEFFDQPPGFRIECGKESIAFDFDVDFGEVKGLRVRERGGVDDGAADDERGAVVG